MKRTSLENCCVNLEVNENDVKIFIHQKGNIESECLYINLENIGEFGHSERAYISHGVRQIMHQLLLPNVKR